MYHRISQVNVEEVNRVLRLIQDQMPNIKENDKGKSDRKPIISNINQTNASGIFIVTESVSTGLTNITPINFSVSVSTNYPSFGWGSNWGNNWGL
jgi:flavin reductase (DIM6/NTAB) family NADH-FMN oxidoreductase RutF